MTPELLHWLSQEGWVIESEMAGVARKGNLSTGRSGGRVVVHDGPGRNARLVATFEAGTPQVAIYQFIRALP